MNFSNHTHSNDPAGGSAPLRGLDAGGIIDETAITDAATLAELLEASPLEDALEELETMNARLHRVSTQLEEQTSAIREQTTAIESQTHASYEIARHLDRMISDWRKARESRESIL
jgi:hypothetical protein